MATEKSITGVATLSNGATNLSGYNFTMSNSSGTAARLPGSVFANLVMGTSAGYKIWMGSKAAYTALGSYDSSTAYLIIP